MTENQNLEISGKVVHNFGKSDLVKKSCTVSNNLSTNFLSKQNQNLQNFANVTYRLNAQKIGLGIENQALESVRAYKLFDNQI